MIVVVRHMFSTLFHFTRCDSISYIIQMCERLSLCLSNFFVDEVGFDRQVLLGSALGTRADDVDAATCFVHSAAASSAAWSAFVPFFFLVVREQC